MTSIFSLGEWFDITEKNGTYGDQVSDILASWKVDRDELVASLEFWKRMAKEGEAEINELTHKNSLLQLKVTQLQREQ